MKIIWPKSVTLKAAIISGLIGGIFALISAIISRQPSNYEPPIYPTREDSSISLSSKNFSPESSSLQSSSCPTWFTNLPNNPDYLYSVATAISINEQLAVDKAKLGCRSDIASQLQIHLEQFQKQYLTETSKDSIAHYNEKFDQITKSFVSATLTHCKILKVKTIREDGKWRACILMEYPKNAGNDYLINILKNQNI